MSVRRSHRFPFALALALAWLPGVAPGARAQQIYWLDTRYAAPTLNRANPDGTGRQFISLPAGSLPEGLVLDPVRHALFWTEASYSGARVRRCNLDLTFPADVVTGGSALRGIAADAASGRLFWTTSNTVTGPLVRRANADGSAATTIVTLPPAMNPRGVAFSATPAPAAIYLSDPATDALYKYDVNGPGGVLMTVPPGTKPYGLAVDGTNGLVYFTEYGLGRITRCTTGGLNRLQVLGGLLNPTYLALDVPGNRMFWIEGGPGTQRVMRAALTGASMVNLNLPETSYGGIAYASSAQLVGVDGDVAPALRLGAVSPNPAFGRARVDYELPREGPVRLSVFDLQGREVAVLDDGVRAAGRHSASVEAGRVRPGMYFVRLRAEDVVLDRRMVIVR